MKTIEECDVYNPEIKRVTKSNSFVADGRVVYVVKKDYEGKTIKVYVAYDRVTGVKLAAHWDKDTLVRFVQQQDMSVFGKDEGSLF